MTEQSTTMTAIKDHIIDSEGAPAYPCLDIKGNVTIGTGFKVDNEDGFAALDLQVRKYGVPGPATEDEKRTAFRQMQKIAQDRNGDFNKNASFYEDKVNIGMSKGAIDRKLEQEITTRVDKIKSDVGEAAWDKLNDAQKATTVDIHYANGSLDDFPQFKQALKAGEANRMARESTFYTDEEKGLRARDRLLRNYQALFPACRKPRPVRPLMRDWKSWRK